jgi:hypothetical protein
MPLKWNKLDSALPDFLSCGTVEPVSCHREVPLFEAYLSGEKESYVDLDGRPRRMTMTFTTHTGADAEVATRRDDPPAEFPDSASFAYSNRRHLNRVDD